MMMETKVMVCRSMLWAVMGLLLGSGAGAVAQSTPVAPAAGTTARPTPAGGAAAKQPAAPELPAVTAECKAALASAKAAAGAVKGLEGPDRLQALERAAQAYEKVLVDFAADAAGCAAAAFEAGDLWRRQGNLDAARAQYARAAQLDPGRWAERGGMGVADMLRRQKQMEAALAAYRAVIALGTTTNRAHDARVWVGRCLDATGAVDEALQAYRDALESAATPRQVIDAGNWLAKALISRGDLDGAQSALSHVESAVAAVEVARAGERERLQKAVEAMSARRQLLRARDKAQGAAKDAAQLGGDGGGR